MKIPKSVNIMGHEYKIEMVKPSQFRMGKAGDVQIASNGQMGECEYPTRVIRLSKAYEGKLLYFTLLHEIRHGYQFEMGYPQLMHGQVMELDCESFVSFVMSLKKQKIL